MRLFKHTIVIAKPREAVFDFFVDFTNASSWRAFVRTMEPVEPGPVHAGSVIHVVMDLAGGEYAFDLDVLACDRPSLWRHKTNEVDFAGYIEYRFDADPAGTRITFSCEAKPVTLYGWLAIPLLWLRRGRSYREQLPALKRVLETQDPETRSSRVG